MDRLTSKRVVCPVGNGTICSPLCRRGGRREASSPFKEGVSSHQGEALLTSRKRPLCLQTILFTPLSIRRGGGGEAVVGAGVRLFFILKH